MPTTVGSNNTILSNGLIERIISVNPGRPCITTSLRNPNTGTEFLRPGSKEFTVTVNGQELSGQDFGLIEIVDYPGNPHTWIASLERPSPSPDEALKIQLHFQIYPEYPLVRKWLTFTNIGKKPVTLTDLNWEDLNLIPGEPENAEVWSDYFTRRVKAIVDTMDNPAILVNDPQKKEGFIAANEAAGPLKRIEVFAQNSRVAIGFNKDDETIFARTLESGESFQTPAGFVLLFHEPIPQDMVDQTYAGFVADHLTVYKVSEVPSVTIGTWIPFETKINAQLLKKQVRVAAKLGADAYQIDDGWSKLKGDWQVDTEKFPKGLREISDLIRNLGLRVGLWMAPATADEESLVFKQHPEWVATNKQGEWNRHPTPGAVTMCLASDYYYHIRDKIIGAIEEFNVSLLKLDLSILRNVYHPGYFNGCSQPNHLHHSYKESSWWIMERLFDLVKEIKQKHPECKLDITYEALGVTDGTDLGLTQAVDSSWITNFYHPDDAINLRREIYQRGRVTSPWTLNFGGTLIDHPNALNYGFFSTLTSHAMFWGDLATLDNKTITYYQKWFRWIKDQRTKSDFYRYYKVSDIFPVPDGASSRDFRNAIPTTRYGITPTGIHPPAFDPSSIQKGKFWDGVARLDKNGEGPIFLFRPEGNNEKLFQLLIPWTIPDAIYNLDDKTEDRRIGTFSGQDLKQLGIPVRIEESMQAKIIVLELASPHTGKKLA